uniref:Ig-like domain-containing protein n=1 Tax=Neogobius melanostomus TaxID=47308 RepID=A0A8C6SLW4_9GOBI
MNVCGFILIISLSSYYFSPCASNIDEEILCVYNESCVLPCRFTPGSDLEIQWTQTDRSLTVHRFYQGQNQDWHQYQKYRGRTSLFEEEMNRGNASLLLRDVTVEDQGRYLCLANGQVTYVNMKVFAPVSQVQVYSISGDLYCQADNIYPEPSLKWTKNSDPTTEPQTAVYRRETGLYSVYSSVRLPPDPPYEYICTVGTVYSTNSTTYEETAPENHNLHYLWILAVILFAVVCFLIFYCQKKKKNISLPRTPPTSGDEESGSRDPLNSGGNSEPLPPSENGHANGLDKETSM